jgi:hypothetical protein
MEASEIKEPSNNDLIDMIIDRLTEDISRFTLTYYGVVSVMTDEDDLKFYSRIGKSLIEGNKNISYEEKARFITVHCEVVENINK